MELESGIELSKVQDWKQLVFWSRTGPCYWVLHSPESESLEVDSLIELSQVQG